MQSSLTGLNNLWAHITETMMLQGHDMSFWLIIILHARGVTKAYGDSNRERTKKSGKSD